MATLILVRQGPSTGNAANRFTGWMDGLLNRTGRKEAIAAANQIRDYSINVAFMSLLSRR